MHLWIIYGERHLSRTLKKSIKTGLYPKAVQVYYVPNLYPVK